MLRNEKIKGYLLFLCVSWENDFGLSYEYRYEEPGNLDFDTWRSRYLDTVVVE